MRDMSRDTGCLQWREARWGLRSASLLRTRTSRAHQCPRPCRHRPPARRAPGRLQLTDFIMRAAVLAMASCCLLLVAAAPEGAQVSSQCRFNNSTELCDVSPGGHPGRQRCRLCLRTVHARRTMWRPQRTSLLGANAPLGGRAHRRGIGAPIPLQASSLRPSRRLWTPATPFRRS